MRHRLLVAATLSIAACGGDPADEATGGDPGGDEPSGDAALVERAAANLARVAAEIDTSHLASYRLEGEIGEQFLQALELDHAGAEPEQLAARLRALASMAFTAAPDILPPEGGRTTPFHGLDMDQLEALMAIESAVAAAGPLSVCETRYAIETYVRPRAALGSLDTYRAGYQEFAASCPAADLDEWYAFRGHGALRPSWDESNIMERFLWRMLERCPGPDPGWQEECARWDAGRRAYRLAKNREVVARFLHHDLAQEARLADTSGELVLFEDRSGDGVAEFLMDGPASLMSGEPVDFDIVKTGDFTGLMKLNVEGSLISVRGENIAPELAAQPGVTRELVAAPDMGLASLFPDPAALLPRFQVLIDRHRELYRTYTSLRPDSASISSQASPLVASSVTLGDAHRQDTAGAPPGGRAGLVFLARIPFDRVLGAEDLGANRALDLDRAWLDLATFGGPRQVAALGAVPAENIEGILVVGRPAALDL
ncbi:MAG TPA: hypothetical protein VFU21_32260 [Kofleriaceae bacterium]|nr:hypothetical protein [Kofleriaceae bacterium]